MKYWLWNIFRMNVKPRPGGLDLRYSEWIRPPKFIKDFLKTLAWEDLVQYPDTNLLRYKLAEYHNIKKENIFLGPGSSECIKSVFDCFTQSESVVTTYPCFPMYNVYAAQNGIHINQVWPEEDYTYDINKLSGGNLLIISRPSNPLGSVLSKNDVVALLKQNCTRWVLIDEAYIDYSINAEGIIELINEHKNLIISRSFSKTFGAAGIRVGYLLSDESNINLITKFRQMYEITGPSLKYALFLLENIDAKDAYCKETEVDKNKLINLLKRRGYKTVSSGGNWIHIEQDDKLKSLLKENNIHVKEDIILPYSTSKWVRMTVGPDLSKSIKKIFK